MGLKPKNQINIWIQILKRKKMQRAKAKDIKREETPELDVFTPLIFSIEYC